MNETKEITRRRGERGECNRISSSPSASPREPTFRLMSKEKTLQIRNSTAEFLIFTRQAGEDGIEVRVEEETVWLTQKLMSALFDVDVRTVNEHLGNIYQSGEQSREATIRKYRTVRSEGARQVARAVEHYNLDAIIAVGFRVNSVRAIQFRQWATGVLRDFAIRGYVLDKERLKNGAFLSKEYYENLLAEIREIRASERRFYQKITDIYATAMDYSPDAETTHAFFATVQNKLHFAIHGSTAAELIVARADSKKERMGLTTWKKAPHRKIIKPDVVVAKNYLTEKELKSLDRVVTMYLDYAEDQAERKIPMTMQDWAGKGFGPDQLSEMQKIIDAEKSDLFDVLAHVAYALPPLTREDRATKAKVEISTHFNTKQQVFLDFVLSHYVSVEVEELDQTKLTPLLRLKYHNSLTDAVADLGKPEEIGKVFTGFQKYLYGTAA